MPVWFVVIYGGSKSRKCQSNLEWTKFVVTKSSCCSWSLPLLKYTIFNHIEILGTPRSRLWYLSHVNLSHEACWISYEISTSMSVLIILSNIMWSNTPPVNCSKSGMFLWDANWLDSKERPIRWGAEPPKIWA